MSEGRELLRHSWAAKAAVQLALNRRMSMGGSVSRSDCDRGAAVARLRLSAFEFGSGPAAARISRPSSANTITVSEVAMSVSQRQRSRR